MGVALPAPTVEQDAPQESLRIVERGSGPAAALAVAEDAQRALVLVREVPAREARAATDKVKAREARAAGWKRTAKLADFACAIEHDLIAL